MCVKRGGPKMPTINQLVRKRRSDKVRKSKSPVLGIGFWRFARVSCSEPIHSGTPYSG